MELAIVALEDVAVALFEVACADKADEALVGGGYAEHDYKADRDVAEDVFASLGMDDLTLCVFFASKKFSLKKICLWNEPVASAG